MNRYLARLVARTQPGNFVASTPVTPASPHDPFETVAPNFPLAAVTRPEAAATTVPLPEILIRSSPTPAAPPTPLAETAPTTASMPSSATFNFTPPRARIEQTTRTPLTPPAATSLAHQPESLPANSAPNVMRHAFASPEKNSTLPTRPSTPAVAPALTVPATTLLTPQPSSRPENSVTQSVAEPPSRPEAQLLRKADEFMQRLAARTIPLSAEPTFLPPVGAPSAILRPPPSERSAESVPAPPGPSIVIGQINVEVTSPAAVPATPTPRRTFRPAPARSGPGVRSSTRFGLGQL